MQISRILQAVVLMMIVALAASCAASKEYSSKLFSPRNENIKDSIATALRFLELENLQTEKEGWVSTDIIMGRDTGSKTLALDNLAKIFPAASVPKDTTVLVKDESSIPILVETTAKPVIEQPIIINSGPTTVRTKKTREK